ncbi:hypothetical protein [Halobaculum marinum]|uniref:Uncharacterized protein n=1 Tax=Halobaculum marinum TaxID=3031996 RepID=A0ABD5X3Y7_9EURY|nr:hypothetical protein [Halobaculum sp. DT55]
MTRTDVDPVDRTTSVSSHAYRITLDNGRETFDALEICDDHCPEAYLMSDTVHSLEAMR